MRYVRKPKSIDEVLEMHSRFPSLDAALAALAVGPPAFAVLELSTPMLLCRAPTYPEIYAAYRHRRSLVAAGVTASTALLWRARRDGGSAKRAKGATTALAALAAAVPLIYDPCLFKKRSKEARVLRAEDVAAALPEDDTEVAGVRINGAARAYPLRKMARPHVLYDTLGEERIAITYCGLTNSALVYRPERDTRAPELSVVSAPNNNILYWEEGTGALVQQLLPEPAHDPERGRLPLRTLPVTFTTWEAWCRMVPQTTFGDSPFESLRDRLITALMRRTHMKTRVEEKPFLAVSGEVDRTLHPKARVFALCEGSRARAYTRGFLKEKRVVNDEAGGCPFVVFYDPESEITMAYRSEPDGRRLRFRPKAGGFVDEQSGTCWDVLGRATYGPLAGRTLEPVPFSFDNIFWFAWKHYHPDTLLYRLPGEDGQPRTPDFGTDVREDPDQSSATTSSPCRGACSPISERSGVVGFIKACRRIIGR